MLISTLPIKNFEINNMLLTSRFPQTVKQTKNKFRNHRNFVFVKNQRNKQEMPLKKYNSAYIPVMKNQSENNPTKICKNTLNRNISITIGSQINNYKEERNNSQGQRKKYNYFPQRKTKKVTDSKWYKYCLDNFTSEAPIINSKQVRPQSTCSHHSPIKKRKVYTPQIQKRKSVSYRQKHLQQKKIEFGEISPWENVKQQLTK